MRWRSGLLASFSPFFVPFSFALFPPRFFLPAAMPDAPTPPKKTPLTPESFSSPAGWMAHSGDVEGLSRWLAEHPDAVSEADPKVRGFTLLAIAANAGRAECVRFLLPLSDATALDAHGFTVLQVAAASKRFRGDGEPDGKGSDPLACARQLLAFCDPRARRQDKDGLPGATALMLAARVGNLAMTKLLLPLSDLDAFTVFDSRPGTAKWTALSFAAHEGRLEVCKLLLAASPASPLGECEGTLSHPLFAAAILDHADCAALIATASASADAPQAWKSARFGPARGGRDVFQFAAGFGAVKTLEALAPLFAETAWASNAPLALAARAGQPEAVRWLLAHGHDPDWTGMDAGHLTPLMEAITAEPPENRRAFAERMECAKILAERSTLSLRDRHGRDIVGLAATVDNDAERIEWLRWTCELRDPAEASPRGETPLMLAAQDGHADAVAFLCDLADPWAGDARGNDALLLAARKAWVQIKTLRDMDVGAREREEQNPETTAAELAARFRSVLAAFPAGAARERSIGRAIESSCADPRDMANNPVLDALVDAFRPSEAEPVWLGGFMGALGRSGLWKVADAVIDRADDDLAVELHRLCFASLMPRAAARLESIALRQEISPRVSAAKPVAAGPQATPDSPNAGDGSDNGVDGSSKRAPRL
jgi:ankyrin repeat protein